MSTEPIVPVDVYYNILYRMRDLPWLWTTCRAVSRDFRAAVELVFIRHHLPKTGLGIDCGMFVDPMIGKVFLGANFEFDGLDPNETSIATFREKGPHGDFKPQLIEHLKAKFDNKYGNLCHAPRIIIQIRRMANDTPICDMIADWDNLKLAANWKKMFSEFFAEEKAYASISRGKLDAAKREIVAVRDAPDFDLVQVVYQAFMSCTNDVRKEVRARRIKRHVWEQSHIDWECTDSVGDRDVLELRDSLADCQFSDDEYYGEEAHIDKGNDSDDEDEDDDADEESDEDEEEDEEDEDEDDDECSEEEEDEIEEGRIEDLRSQ